MSQSESNRQKEILIGNTFSMTLIQAPKVTITVAPLDLLKKGLREGVIHSFWGHENTRPIAEQIAGVSLKPRVSRPAIELDPRGPPVLDGIAFRVCWVLSPEYAPGFRPGITEEVAPDRITGWQVLRIEWNVCKDNVEGKGRSII